MEKFWNSRSLKKEKYWAIPVKNHNLIVVVDGIDFPKAEGKTLQLTRDFQTKSILYKILNRFSHKHLQEKIQKYWSSKIKSLF